MIVIKAKRTTGVVPPRGLSKRRRPPHRPEVLVKAWAVTVLATILYAWGIGHAELQPYYTAGVRSMSGSWHAFVYGALDPSGSITMDKLPGALWLQALSVRVFGPHVWAVALPQVLEGALTVLVLFKVVADWAGPAEGALAALILALTPITVALNRHNISDTLLILLLVLAAGATLRAIRTGRLLPLLACALWVGLAFQAKMLQAWLVVPGLAAAYLLASLGSWLRRLGRLMLAGIVLVVTSSAWLVMVFLTPAGKRPFIDATTTNNPFDLVLGYNALSRFDSSGGDALSTGGAHGAGGGPHWNLLVNHVYASQIGWLLPAALLALVLGMVWLRAAPRTDVMRAGLILWGLWLVVHAVAFGASTKIHTYYTAALAPAIAALAGAGLVWFWREHAERGLRAWALPAAVTVTLGWHVWLSERFPGFLPWLPALLVLAGLATIASQTRVLFMDPLGERGRTAVVVAVITVLVAPTAWAVSALNPRYAGPATAPAAGPVGAHFREYAKAISVTHRLPEVSLADPTLKIRALLMFLRDHHGAERYLLATERARLAEPLLRLGGVTVLPMGGFSGDTPFPTPVQLASLVAGGDLRFVLLSHATAIDDSPKMPAAAWTKAHCRPVPHGAYGFERRDADLYDCRF